MVLISSISTELSNRNMSRSQSIISIPEDTDYKLTFINSAWEATFRKRHIKVMKTNEYEINTLYDKSSAPYGAKKLTIQEDDSSRPFVQHISYGGLRGELTWKWISPIYFPHLLMYHNLVLHVLHLAPLHAWHVLSLSHRGKCPWAHVTILTILQQCLWEVL